MTENNTKFEYNYSAKEQAELKKIRAKYEKPTETEDKMDRLRKLDAGVAQKAQAVSLVLGVIGMLILGTGMSLCMSDFANILGSHKDMAMVIGIVMGIIGGAIAALAYPVYNITLNKEKKKVAPEIIRLTDELMK